MVRLNNYFIQSQTGESREVIHCQFTCWPDYGVPHSAAAMLDFLFQVREIQASAVQALGDTWTGHPLGPPILVHCSAGIGRTGELTMEHSSKMCIFIDIFFKMN